MDSTDGTTQFYAILEGMKASQLQWHLSSRTIRYGVEIQWQVDVNDGFRNLPPIQSDRQSQISPRSNVDTPNTTGMMSQAANERTATLRINIEFSPSRTMNS